LGKACPFHCFASVIQRERTSGHGFASSLSFS
jgi:hypothetical protein